MNRIEKKFCLSCGTYLSGRSDKKFCDDACRTSFHNRGRQEKSDIFRETDSILRLNRRILSGMVEQQQKLRLNSKQLLSAGFRPDYVTRIASDSGGSIVRYYYEFGLRRLSASEVEVFRLKRAAEVRSCVQERA